MKDIQREKFARAMREVEELEDKVAQMEAAGITSGKFQILLEELAEARKKLTRLSDGCGPGRTPGA